MGGDSRTREIAELLRVHLRRHNETVDDVALRKLIAPEVGPPLVSLPRGQRYPVVTERGAEIVSEILAVWETQT